MLRLHAYPKSTRGLFRWIHSSDSPHQPLKIQPLEHPRLNIKKNKESLPFDDKRTGENAKRNEVGVQLLSRTLHSQLFPNVKFPPPEDTFVQIAKEHLKQHGLDPEQGSVLPDIGFELPPLQGDSLVEHFHRLGSQASEPWMSLARSFVTAKLPPKPEHWEIQSSGWIKYTHASDGTSFCEHVEYPMHDGKPEKILTFDIETLYKEHPYPIMACAASPNSWYAWISPWLLGETEDPQQLVPLGDPTVPRIIIGHNVSYDRARVLEEYSLQGTQNKFIDTMSLHVAVKGISSHQRPEWTKYRKLKQEEENLEEEAKEAAKGLFIDMDTNPENMTNEKRAELDLRRQQLVEFTLPDYSSPDSDTIEAEMQSKRWEDITSVNSLAEVAMLHCNIEVDKAVRDDFGTRTREEIKQDLHDYLDYCSNDVDVTQCVYAKALPEFLEACPHPVSFAGILTMGSSFLPVNEGWEKYINQAESVYRELEEKVKGKLKTLADEAKELANGSDNSEPWKADPWLSQLDWTPKVAGKSRGFFPPDLSAESTAEPPADTTPVLAPVPELGPEPVPTIKSSNPSTPAWFEKFSRDPTGDLEEITPYLLKLSYDDHPLQYSKKKGWHFIISKNKQAMRIYDASGEKFGKILGGTYAFKQLQSGQVQSIDNELAIDLSKPKTKQPPDISERLLALAKSVLNSSTPESIAQDPWLSKLDWTLVASSDAISTASSTSGPEPEPGPAATIKSSNPSTPAWFEKFSRDPTGGPSLEKIVPYLLKLSYDGHPLQRDQKEGWHFLVDGKITRISITGQKIARILTPKHTLKQLQDGQIQSIDNELAIDLSMPKTMQQPNISERLLALAKSVLNSSTPESIAQDPWLSKLDWTSVASSDAISTASSTSEPEPEPGPAATIKSSNPSTPAWFEKFSRDPTDGPSLEKIVPYLLKLSYDGHPLQRDQKEGWHFLVDGKITHISTTGQKIARILTPKHTLKQLQDGQIQSIDNELAIDLSKPKIKQPPDVSERLIALAKSVLNSSIPESIPQDPWLSKLDWKLVDPEVEAAKAKPKKPVIPKPKPVYWPTWYWEATKPKKGMPPGSLDITGRNRIAPLLLKLSWKGCPLFHSRQHGWTFRVQVNAHAESKDTPSLSDTVPSPSFSTRAKPLEFQHKDDEALAEASLHGGYAFYKVPHKDGEEANVGNPLAKPFMKYALEGTLKSPGDEAKEALDLNILCSYWISARDRIMNQLVIWQKGNRNLGIPTHFPSPPSLISSPPSNASSHGLADASQAEISASSGAVDSIATTKQPQQEEQEPQKWGIILPQVITMGAVTRRAIERTWLTASNAKRNRVGSELKAMICAPPGYAIVGADVDSEELWISSCMGDAQFGVHGATALGWMTLEGTKSAGTDLHSKTASILGISRDQAKVFNYSRIYGAGMKHAILLLQQGNPKMAPEEAQKLAENLYASTKGKKTGQVYFDRKFWYGGTESYVFNKLEEIAMSDKPQTPALGCGVTYALSKEYLPSKHGTDYMPSRINWVVQSSGVDYLHLLIVSMDHLIREYDINARYLISVHDEIRYLVSQEDRYRCALALQIANLWTRALFAYRLGMNDLPQGVAFFSSVDIDHVLRKEVDMDCVTPSHPDAIPPGENLDIAGIMKKTNRGCLRKDKNSDEVINKAAQPFSALAAMRQGGTVHGEGAVASSSYSSPVTFDEEIMQKHLEGCLVHRSKSAGFLLAQSTNSLEQVKALSKQNGSKVTTAAETTAKNKVPQTYNNKNNAAKAKKSSTATSNRVPNSGAPFNGKTALSEDDLYDALVDEFSSPQQRITTAKGSQSIKKCS